MNDYLIEVYDSQGACFTRWRSTDPMTAIAELGLKCMDWRGLGFRNASCYLNSVEQWNLEVK